MGRHCQPRYNDGKHSNRTVSQLTAEVTVLDSNCVWDLGVWLCLNPLQYLLRFVSVAMCCQTLARDACLTLTVALCVRPGQTFLFLVSMSRGKLLTPLPSLFPQGVAAVSEAGISSPLAKCRFPTEGAPKLSVLPCKVVLCAGIHGGGVL